MYSVKDAYNWLMKTGFYDANDGYWRWIWRLKVPANVHFFLWQLCHESIPTTFVLKGRGIISCDTCPICGIEVETIAHCHERIVLGRQGFGMHVLFRIWGNHNAHNMDTSRWLHGLVSTHGILVPVCLWVIWTARNRFIFDNIKHTS